jgi:hypothetical protein
MITRNACKIFRLIFKDNKMYTVGLITDFELLLKYRSDLGSAHKKWYSRGYAKEMF